MKRFGVRIAATLFVTAIGALSAPACVHVDSSLFIRGIPAPPVTGGASGSCVYSTDVNQAMLGSGRLDISSTRLSYSAYLLVGSQMIARGSTEQVRAETARVIVQGGTVRVTDVVGNELGSYTTLGSGIIDPAQGISPAYGLIELTLLSKDVVKKLKLSGKDSTQVISYVKVFGQTLGGQSVESAEYQFPIFVCNGCLQTAAGSTSGSSVVVVPCVCGQEIPFSCGKSGATCLCGS